MHDGRNAATARRFVALATAACLMLVGLSACLFAPITDGMSRPTFLRTVPATGEEIGDWPTEDEESDDSAPVPTRDDESRPPGSTHAPIPPSGTSES